MRITKDDLNKVNYLTIGFENCECMTTPTKDIEYIMMNEITEDLFLFTNNSYRDVKIVCNSLYIKFKSEVETAYVFLESDKDILTRITECNDITSIDLTENIQDYYESGFVVKWCMGDEYNNRYQMSKKDKNGNLHVYIGEDEGMIKMFNKNVGIGK